MGVHFGVRPAASRRRHIELVIRNSVQAAAINVKCGFYGPVFGFDSHINFSTTKLYLLQVNYVIEVAWQTLLIELPFNLLDLIPVNLPPDVSMAIYPLYNYFIWATPVGIVVFERQVAIVIRSQFGVPVNGWPYVLLFCIL